MDVAVFLQNLQYAAVELGSHHPAEIMLILFARGGWVFFVIVFFWGMWGVYINYIQTKYAQSLEWSILAIDIPQENLQSVKAVENIFSALWPFYESRNLIDKYISGSWQQAITLEIVSIGGNVQFMIRVPSTHRDLAEAAIYGQYPKAEISEVEDYTERYKGLRFPSEEYDLWGTEYGLAMPSVYPIRTHPAFEHGLTQTFADPMAQMLEVMSRLNRDEEVWMQMIITPLKAGWKEEGYKIINKIIGAKQPEAKKGILGALLAPFYYAFTLIEELFIYGIGYEPGKIGSATEKVKLNEPPNKMLYLTPEEKNVIEGISAKISKIGFQTKLRTLYIGRTGKMNKAKGAGSVIGALQQFSTQDLNQFVPLMRTMTKANYFFVKRRVIARQNRILRAYASRGQTDGWGKGFVLNIEELATLFHFPQPDATREGVQTVAAKKEAPPSGLPDTIFEEMHMAGDELGPDELPADDAAGAADASVKSEPPSNLPV